MKQLTERVLFIYADDDQDDHVILTDAIKLSHFRYELKSVYNGEELFKLLSEKASDLQPTFLVVDLNMPGMDGLAAIMLIKTRLSLNHIPIYMLTTSARAEERQRAKELGVAGFYTKPSKINELKDLIEEMTLKALQFQEKGITNFFIKK